ncbi:hypothetical protein EKO04_008078 [Ascochyta lentis]|uniref:Uncharacterized protein n=1 Tax=Ascochyta lentis TaxID=205686 RepID=A0A8H7J026_9PLEO|nr:hypothetical protein EKO04_008078 [Ascochyta lentis]
MELATIFKNGLAAQKLKDAREAKRAALRQKFKNDVDAKKPVKAVKVKFAANPMAPAGSEFHSTEIGIPVRSGPGNTFDKANPAV